MVLVDGTGLPLAIDVSAANPAEVTLIEPLLDQVNVTQLRHIVREVIDDVVTIDPKLRDVLVEGRRQWNEGGLSAKPSPLRKP